MGLQSCNDLILKKRFGYLALTESQWEAMWFVEPGFLKQRWMAKVRLASRVSRVALGQWALLGGPCTRRIAIFNAAVSHFWKEFTSKALILDPCSWSLHFSMVRTPSWLLTRRSIGLRGFFFFSLSQFLRFKLDTSNSWDVLTQQWWKQWKCAEICKALLIFAISKSSWGIRNGLFLTLKWCIYCVHACFQVPEVYVN